MGDRYRVERGDHLNGHRIVMQAADCRALLNFVAGFDELIAVGAVAGNGLIHLAAGTSARGDRSGARGHIPPRMQNGSRFDVSDVPEIRRNLAVIELETLPFSGDIQMTPSPLRIHSHSGCGQLVGRRFSWKIELALAIEIGPAIAGSAHAQPLADGVAGATGPVTV